MSFNRQARAGYKYWPPCGVPVNMQHEFQWFLFMNPCVLQFINRRVDIPAACRSWYAQCTLCSSPWTSTGTWLRWCLRACCCAATGALVGARRKLWSSAVAVSLGCAMLGSTVYTCSASSSEAFGRISTIFLVTWWTRDPEVNSRRCLHTWPMRKGPRSSSIMAVAVFSGFACDAPRAVFPMIAGSFFFSSALELHLEICTLFLRALCIFSIFSQSKFCASRFFGALEHSQL